MQGTEQRPNPEYRFHLLDETVRKSPIAMSFNTWQPLLGDLLLTPVSGQKVSSYLKMADTLLELVDQAKIR